MTLFLIVSLIYLLIIAATWLVELDIRRIRRKIAQIQAEDEPIKET